MSTFNLDIPRYNFTIVRLFNIFPYISLYFEDSSIFFYTFLDISNKQPDSPLVLAPGAWTAYQARLVSQWVFRLE